MSYSRNFSRELILEVTRMERNHDRLVMSLQALVKETEGTGKGRIHALKLLNEITGGSYESLDNTDSKKQDHDIFGSISDNRGTTGIN